MINTTCSFEVERRAASHQPAAAITTSPLELACTIQRMRIASLCGLVCLVAMYATPASAGAYCLTVADGPVTMPGFELLRSNDAAAKLVRYFAAGDDPGTNFVASFLHRRVSFRSATERDAVLQALASCLLIPQPQHEDYLMSFIENRDHAAMRAALVRLKTDGASERVRRRIQRARSLVARNGPT